MVQYFKNAYEVVSSAIKGMGITFKHIYTKPVTLQYPDERWVLPERFKGFIINDTWRCDGCLRCGKRWAACVVCIAGTPKKSMTSAPFRL